MRILIFGGKFLIGALLSYYLMRRLVLPILEDDFKNLGIFQVFLGSFLGGLLFFIFPPLWVLLIIALYILRWISQQCH